MTIARSDNRFALLELLGRYRPIDDADRMRCERIAEFIKTTPRCFERGNLEGHITGSAWVVDKSRERVLLTHHKKLGKWLQLGGHADGNPDVMDVAMREAREESGLTDLRALSPEIFDVDVHPIPQHGAEPAHIHYDVRFIFQTVEPDRFVMSSESDELAWVEMKKISNFSQEESMLRMAKKGEL